MPRTTSNLTNTELRRIFEVNENSPLFEHIKQISNNYLSLYQERRRWRNLSNDIKREMYEAMKLIKETNEGPLNQFNSFGCSIKWANNE